MFSEMFSKGMNILGNTGNALAKAGGGTPTYQQGPGDAPGMGDGLMGLINKFKANRYQTPAGAQGPGLAQGGGLGQPGAQAGTLFGSMGPARSSQQY